MPVTLGHNLRSPVSPHGGAGWAGPSRLAWIFSSDRGPWGREGPVLMWGAVRDASRRWNRPRHPEDTRVKSWGGSAPNLGRRRPRSRARGVGSRAGQPSERRHRRREPPGPRSADRQPEAPGAGPGARRVRPPRLARCYRWAHSPRLKPGDSRGTPDVQRRVGQRALCG